MSEQEYKAKDVRARITNLRVCAEVDDSVQLYREGGGEE